MRLKEEQINRLADKVLTDLTKADLIKLKRELGGVLAGIRGAISANIKAEEAIERDAEALLDKTLQSVDNTGIDRHKMLRMIKEKLAKERKFVL